VRSLYDASRGKNAPEDISRDYRLVLDKRRGSAPLLTVYGGKITTYRRLAEDALGKLSPFFQMHPRWTTDAALPGGEFAWDAFETRVAETIGTWPFLSEPDARRLARAYGTRVDRILGEAKGPEDIGPFFGPLSAAEVRYLMKEEWAQTADDVLWRRSKLGLRFSGGQREVLARFMTGQVGSGAAPL